MTCTFTGTLLRVYDLSSQNRPLVAGKILTFDNMNNVSGAVVRGSISFHKLESKDHLSYICLCLRFQRALEPLDFSAPLASTM